MAAKAANPIAKKIGPLPAWAWLVSAVVVFFLYRRLAAGGTAAAAASPTSVPTSTSTVPVQTGGGAPASGQGSAIDNTTASLLSSLFGNAVQINSNLVTGLLGATSSIEGLGSTALQQEGAITQAWIYSQTGSGGNSGGSSTPGKTAAATSAPTPVTSHPIASSNQGAAWVGHQEYLAHEAANQAQGYWTAGF